LEKTAENDITHQCNCMNQLLSLRVVYQFPNRFTGPQQLLSVSINSYTALSASDMCA